MDNGTSALADNNDALYEAMAYNAKKRFITAALEEAERLKSGNNKYLVCLDR